MVLGERSQGMLPIVCLCWQGLVGKFVVQDSKLFRVLH